MDIVTPRLKLLSCNLSIVESVLKGDDAIAETCKINVTPNWTMFGEPAFRWSQSKLNENPSEQKWLSYLIVLKAENILIGSCGYKGGPTPDGTVEIGYELAETYRGKGLAKELAKALVQNAFSDKNINKVVAHTLAETNASGSILKYCGMVKTAELADPEDGLIWKWEIEKT